jgi:hypothetical protein
MELISYLEVSELILAGLELENRVSFASPYQTPWLEPPIDMHDAQLGVDEHGIDREPHEPRVDVVAGLEPHGGAFRQARVSEQSASAPEKVVIRDHVPRE